MTEKNARQEDLSFTGIYSFYKEEVKARIKEERKERPKARIVLVWSPASKLSRGYSSGGWSAYADEKYSAYSTLERTSKVIDSYDNRVISIKNEYAKKIADAKAEFTTASMKRREMLNLLNN